MPVDPSVAMVSLQQRVTNLEAQLKKLTEVVKVEGGGVQIATPGKLTLKTVAAQIELNGPIVNINNGALEVI